MNTATSDSPADDLSPDEQHAAKQAQAALLHAQKSPLDQSFGRKNDRPNTAHAPSLFDAAEPMTLVSPTFDPGVIKAHEAFEAEGGFGCELAVSAMDALKQAVQNIITARETYRSDVTMTEAAQLLAVDSLYSQQSSKVLPKIDVARATLDKAIASHEAELRKGIKDGATGPFAAETRAMLRGMTAGERMSFLTRAANEGDTVALGAVLGAPAYLSNITADAAQSLTERANKVRNPKLSVQLDLMRHARDKLDAAGSLFLARSEAMIGARHGTVERLRAHKAKLKTVIGAIA